MANKKSWLVMLVALLAMGTIFVGFNSCSKNGDRRLNGTWALGMNGGPIKVIFKNGNYKFISSEDGSIRGKGTYITDDGNITVTETLRYSRNTGLEKVSGLNPGTSKYSVSGDKLTLYDGPGTHYLGMGFDNIPMVGATLGAWGRLELIRDK